MVAYRSPHLVPVTAKVSDVILVEHIPDVQSNAVFVGRLERKGKRWVAEPLLVGSYRVDSTRARVFPRQFDAVQWLIEDMVDQVEIIRATLASDQIGEA